MIYFFFWLCYLKAVLLNNKEQVSLVIFCRKAAINNLSYKLCFL